MFIPDASCAILRTNVVSWILERNMVEPDSNVLLLSLMSLTGFCPEQAHTIVSMTR